MIIEDLRLYIQTHELLEAEDRLYSAFHVLFQFPSLRDRLCDLYCSGEEPIPLRSGCSTLS